MGILLLITTTFRVTTTTTTTTTRTTINATTNSLFLEEFRTDFPKVHWLSLADNSHIRFLQSTPQITTTAGITAGIDGALYQIQRCCGDAVAEAIRDCLEWPLAINNETTALTTSAAAAAAAA